ncbi:MAG: Flavoredoxin [Actinobacteria bacterium ADurb.Bin346]|nr:MAG: Flavoredoxin [Actinobacteria bacterium ADurb.Bin346]
MTVLKKIRNLVLPLPVMLATCRAEKNDPGTDNIIPLAWVGIVEYEPPMVNVMIGSGKYSAVTIENRKEFGLCMATAGMMEKVDFCGYSHGDKVDKFKVTGFSKIQAEKIDAPLIKECPISLECAVRDILKPKNHMMFIAEVLATHIDSKFLKDGEEPDLENMDILCYANDQYWSMGRKLNNLFYSKY